jgi:hypothetical protein
VWFADSEVRGGRVDGAIGELTPGSVRSAGFFRQTMWTAMVSGGANQLIAAGFSDAVCQCWKAWFDGYEVTLEYPSLAAVEHAFAPPVANKPMHLSKGKPAADWLGEASLSAAIELALLAFVAEPGMHEACDEFAAWFSDRFSRWHSAALLMNVLASGPVPSYAPPAVPHGPVVGGTLSSRRPLFTDMGFWGR